MSEGMCRTRGLMQYTVHTFTDPDMFTVSKQIICKKTTYQGLMNKSRLQVLNPDVTMIYLSTVFKIQCLGGAHYII
jgi:hypothetical protein